MNKLIIIPEYKQRVLVNIHTVTSVEDIIISDDNLYYNFIGDFTLDEAIAFAKSLEDDVRKYNRVLFNNTSLSYIFERGTLVSAKSGRTCSG